MDEDKAIKIGIFVLLFIFLVASPIGIVIHNSYKYSAQKIDDMTDYDTMKKVEDTCRSLIVSYETDKLMYEQYKDSDIKEERSWANNAKIRANKTAVTYNEYILKNSYVFQNNIPKDIKMELEILE